MNIFFSNVLIGVISGIITGLIVFLFTRFFKIEARDKINYHTIKIWELINVLQNHIEFPSDFYLIYDCAKEIQNHCFKTSISFSPCILFFYPKKKKIIYTFLYDIFCLCERIRYLAIGYDDIKELENRIYKIKVLLYKRKLDGNSCIMDEIICIRNLLHNKKMFFRYENTENYKIYNDDIFYLTDINSFKIKYSNTENYPIRDKGITQKEFLKYYKKIF